MTLKISVGKERLQADDSKLCFGGKRKYYFWMRWICIFINKGKENADCKMISFTYHTKKMEFI